MFSQEIVTLLWPRSPLERSFRVRLRYLMVIRFGVLAMLAFSGVTGCQSKNASTVCRGPKVAGFAQRCSDRTFVVLTTHTLGDTGDNEFAVGDRSFRFQAVEDGFMIDGMRFDGPRGNVFIVQALGEEMVVEESGLTVTWKEARRLIAECRRAVDLNSLLADTKPGG